MILLALAVTPLPALAQKPYRDAVNIYVAMKLGPGDLMARPGQTGTDLYEAFVDLCVARPK